MSFIARVVATNLLLKLFQFEKKTLKLNFDLTICFTRYSIFYNKL